MTETETEKSISEIYEELAARDDAPDEAKEPEADEEAKAAEPAEKESEPAPDEVVAAPTSWSDEERSLFATLPPDAQKAIARRESDREREFTRQTQEFAEKRKTHGELEDVISENRQRWALAGVTPATAFRQLLAAEQALERQPREAIAHLARIYGVDLSSLNQPQRRVDPTVTRLEQRIAELEGRQTQHTEGVKTQRRQEAEAFIERWAGEKGEDGNPLRPYWAEVQTDIASHIRAVRSANPGASMADILNQAYDRAAWANPQVRATLQDVERRKLDAKRAAERRWEAEKAKKAAASVPASQAGASAEGDKSIRAILEEQYAAATQ